MSQMFLTIADSVEDFVADSALVAIRDVLPVGVLDLETLERLQRALLPVLDDCDRVPEQVAAFAAKVVTVLRRMMTQRGDGTKDGAAEAAWGRHDDRRIVRDFAMVGERLRARGRGLEVTRGNSAVEVSGGVGGCVRPWSGCQPRVLLFLQTRSKACNTSGVCKPVHP